MERVMYRLLRFALITFLSISMLGCTTQETKQKRKEAETVLKQAAVDYGKIQLACVRAAKINIPVKKEKYTAFQTVVTGKVKTGSSEHCWRDVYGNVYCNEIDETEDITTQVPYEATKDVNARTRTEFQDACACRNKDYRNFFAPQSRYYTFSLGDTTFSAEYLEKKWREDVKPPGGMRYGFWVEGLLKESIAHSNQRTEYCAGKEAHFKKQTWYKKIPIVD